MWSLALVFAVSASEGELAFERSRIGEFTYEACSIFDVDRDGNLDIVSGGYWFPGPDFSVTIKVCDVEAVNDYFDDFGDFPMDINGDGYLDIVTGAWFGKKLTWRENPQGRRVEWAVHDIADVGNIEKPCFWDIDNDDELELITGKRWLLRRLQRAYQACILMLASPDCAAA